MQLLFTCTQSSTVAYLATNLARSGSMIMDCVQNYNDQSDLYTAFKNVRKLEQELSEDLKIEQANNCLQLHKRYILVATCNASIDYMKATIYR